MSLHYIIDGYNITNHRLFPRASRRAKDSCASLINLIKTNNLCGSPKNTISLVFDGYPPEPGVGQEDGRIRLVFSGSLSADEIIKKAVERSEGRRNTVVISDDKEITAFVKLYGVKVTSVEDFIAAGGVHKTGIKADLKTELNYSQISKINEELKKLWLD